MPISIRASCLTNDAKFGSELVGKMLVHSRRTMGSSIFALFAILLGMVLVILPVLTLSGNVLEIWFAYASLLAVAVEMGALIWVKRDG